MQVFLSSLFHWISFQGTNGDFSNSVGVVFPAVQPEKTKINTWHGVKQSGLVQNFDIQIAVNKHRFQQYSTHLQQPFHKMTEVISLWTKTTYPPDPSQKEKTMITVITSTHRAHTGSWGTDNDTYKRNHTNYIIICRSLIWLMSLRRWR